MPAGQLEKRCERVHALGCTEWSAASRLREMADAKQEKARRDLRRAQANFQRKIDKAHAERLDSFKRAQKAGLSLREISKEVGLHWTRIGQLLRGE
jgi:hypothetical protein